VSHEIVRCSCGKVIRQCRCFAKDKVETTIAHGCADCQRRLAKAVPVEVPIGEYVKRIEN
jgi:hypothetical protein